MYLSAKNQKEYSKRVFSTGNPNPELVAVRNKGIEVINDCIAMEILVMVPS